MIVDGQVTSGNRMSRTQLWKWTSTSSPGDRVVTLPQSIQNFNEIEIVFTDAHNDANTTFVPLQIPLSIIQRFGSDTRWQPDLDGEGGIVGIRFLDMDRQIWVESNGNDGPIGVYGVNY